jgi:thiol-disulfide isomerase/thioredoxin
LFKDVKNTEQLVAEELVLLNEGNFDELIKENYYFVKFFAPWCKHCSDMAPTWKELAAVYNKPASQIQIAQVFKTIWNIRQPHAFLA